MKLKLLFGLFFLTTATFAQDSKPNNIYFELGGNGLFLSMNYERQIIKNENFYGHVGIGMYGIRPTYYTFPFGVNYLLNLKNHRNFIDFGLGANITKADVRLYLTAGNKSNTTFNGPYFNFIPSISYRHHTKKNLMLKFSIAPIFNQYGSIPFFGFSIGKMF